MEQEPINSRRMPTGAEMAADFQKKFETVIEPELRKSERYRNKSRMALERSDVVFIPRTPKRAFRPRV